jgi:hypothetical protein
MIITELACALNIEFIIHTATSTMYSNFGFNYNETITTKNKLITDFKCTNGRSIYNNVQYTIISSVHVT